MRSAIKKVFKAVLQLLADALVISSQKLPNLILKTVKNAEFVSAKCDPYSEKNEIWMIPKTPNDSDVAGIDEFGLPIPNNNEYQQSDFGMLVLTSSGYQTGFDSQVFYDIDFLRRKWGNILDIISITPEAYGDQTAILLGK